MYEEDDVIVVRGKCENTKGETCANQMTDSFQAQKDVMQFKSQARAMRYALVKRLYRCMCSVYGCTVYTLRRFSEILSRRPKSPPFLR